MGERVHRSVMNIKVGMFFYILSIFLAFFSRKIFLDCLGAEFIGLTGMLTNIMSFLSVAELGIGTSIVYFLYKPLQEDNREKVNEIMSMLAFLYRCIGGIIIVGGLLISVFFPWWLHNFSKGLFLVYFTFYSCLASSVAGYLFNYKQLLVSADQKQYLVNAYFQTIGIVQSLVQILLAYYYRNLYLWVLVGLIFTVIGVIIFNFRIRQLYPWLKINLKVGRMNLKKYPEILHKTRQIFIQKIKDFILYRSDEILVAIYGTLVQVAFFGNYTIITSKLNFLVNILSDGMNAGVGNLVAEGNDKNTMKVFWELTAVRFLIVGIVVFGLLLFIQSFIVTWFGPQYRLSDLIVYLLIFNIFIFLSRGVVEMFISAHGLFSDVWAAWTELAVNLIVTLCLAPFYGIVGILLGKIISVFFIAFFWKPYFLFSQGLKKKVSTYWLGMAPYYIIFLIFCTLTIILKNYLIDQRVTSLISLIGYGILIYPILILLYFLTLFIITTGMKYFVARKPFIYNKLHFLTSRLSIICIVGLLTACQVEKPNNNTYEGQLRELRGKCKPFNAHATRFFLFGMGNRDKLVYKDFTIREADKDSTILVIDEAVTDTIIPDNYEVRVQTRSGVVRIWEDSKGIWLDRDGHIDSLHTKPCYVSLPDFKGKRFGRVLRVLHHEILFNIRNSKIYPNIFVYKEPFLRDALMGTMCLEKTGNIHLITDWINNIDDVYDMQNREEEADNLGELLYMLSFIPSDSNISVRKKLIEEIRRVTITKDGHKFISGHTDGVENAEYQTQILKLALQKNNMNDDYTSSITPGIYYDLCWFTDSSEHKRSISQIIKDWRFDFNDSPYPYLQWARAHYYQNYVAPFNTQDYPLSWEKRGGSAVFDGMEVISHTAVKEKICYPHMWTAAEMFLKLFNL